MRRQKLFESVHKNINKFEIRLDKYQIPPIPDANFYPQEEEGEYLKSKEENSRNFPAFTPQYVRDEPKLCVWNYMNENDVKKLLQITSKKEIRKTIGNNMDAEYPKGISRLLIIELMYSILQFCKKSKFNVMQTGSLLSIFYLTHQYFLSSLYTTPEKIFIFFKDNLLLNCLECPPDSIMLFNYKESSFVARYFCKVYLANLPLLRLLTLPNFALKLEFPMPPPPPQDKKKNKRDRKKRI